MFLRLGKGLTGRLVGVCQCVCACGHECYVVGGPAEKLFRNWQRKQTRKQKNQIGIPVWPRRLAAAKWQK